jgi:hypothetical protein
MFAPYSSGLTGPMIKVTDTQKKFLVSAGSNSNTVWNGNQKYAVGMLYQDSFKDPMIMFARQGAKTAAYFCSTITAAITCPASIQRDIIDPFKTYGIDVKYSFPLDFTSSGYQAHLTEAMKNISNADVDLIVIRDYSTLCIDVVTLAVELNWTPKGMFTALCTEQPLVVKTFGRNWLYVTSYTMWSPSAEYKSGRLVVNCRAVLYVSIFS